MAEEKNFEATRSRLEKARRDGDVARSQDLCALFAFAGGAAVVAATVSPLASAFRLSIGRAASGENWWSAAQLVIALVLAPIAAAGFASCAGATLQGGLTFNSPQLKLERLSPVENGKRILSRETLWSAVRSLLAFSCAAAAMVPAMQTVAAGAVHASSTAGLARAAWQSSLFAAAAAGAAAGVFAASDYFSQLRRRRNRLRMSHDELRRDVKEQDGDPVARSRRRSLHRALSRGSLRRVKDAAFVVCNPEHIAIALEYRPPAVPVPRVLVRAADEMAARVRTIAAECGIPLVRSVALARTLYAIDVEHFIPPECYAAVAAIVAELRVGEPT